jgi:hypothetical protein
MAKRPVMNCVRKAKNTAHLSVKIFCMNRTILLLNIPNKNDIVSITIANIRATLKEVFEVMAITKPITVQRIANQVYFSK